MEMGAATAVRLGLAMKTKLLERTTSFVTLLGALIAVLRWSSLAAPLIAAATALFSPPAVASTASIEFDVGSSLSMDYSFTFGIPNDVFAIQSMTVQVGPSSNFSAFLPAFSVFTGFTPLTAPTCDHSTCLDVFGSVPGGPAGFNPYPIWAWFGSVDTYGYDSSSGITLDLRDLAFYVAGSPQGGSHGARLRTYAAGTMDFFSSTGQRIVGLDFDFSNGCTGDGCVIGVLNPVPPTLPLFATGLGVMGLFGWRRKRRRTSAAISTV
jgi:hypothetical protein